LPRLPAIATVVLVVVGLLTAPVSSQPTAAAAVQSVKWRTCSDPELTYLGLECGTLEVPRDHANPGGATVTLALTRREHTSSTYRGVLLVNPGGPGGSGLTMPGLADYVPGDVGATYDWIGFDPRGVGASTPALHCSRSYFTYNRPNYVPRTASITRFWLARNRAYSAACANTNPKRALLPHLTSLATVRDMDLIREALGATTLNFYGFSYGTYLGQVYATQYPTRVGRFVLDGVVNPERVWASANYDQDHAFDRNMDVFWQYLARHPGSFRLGRRWRVIRSGYYSQLRKLDRRPAAGGRLGPDELGDAMLDAGYYVYNWVELGLAYSDLVRKGRGGTLADLYRDGNMGDDNGFAIYNAVQCSDVFWPDWQRTHRRSWAVHRSSPFLTWGNTWYNAPCLSWKAPSHRRLTVSGSAVTSKILLVSETRDAATPYSGALAARRLFPSASLVAGVGGTTHASSLSGVPCVDNAVATYLRTGAVPRRLTGNRSDRHCSRLLPPQPDGAWGRTSGTAPPEDTLSPLLREALSAAQRHGAG
jgi:pimeloyl-ACP methyl ester carboxylesterase